VIYLRGTVEIASDTVSYESSNRFEPFFIAIALYKLSNLIEFYARSTQRNALIQTGFRGLHKEAPPFVHLAHQKGFRTVAMVAVQKDCDIDINNIPVGQLAVIWDSVAGYVVDGSADRL